jgi:hypothetical protein
MHIRIVETTLFILSANHVDVTAAVADAGIRKVVLLTAKARIKFAESAPCQAFAKIDWKNFFHS